MAIKFLKYRQVESILMHLQNAPIYYDKYKKKESEVKALMELIKEEGVAEVTATEEKNLNMRRSVTFEHCSKVRKHKKQPEEGKHQGGSSVSLRKEDEIA